jgi:tRNA(Ile)-lysidine synthase
VLPALERSVRDTGLLAAGRSVLVMVSGGRDSVALLHLATRIAGPGAVSALHVNYGLRGEDSDGDEALCRDHCRRLDVALHVHHPPRPRPRPPGNFQAWARDARYAAAEATATAGTDIATGHTATDQVETILLRLASSPSRRALLGMRERDGRLVRPLLGLTRAETTEFCRSAGLDWREDATNGSALYTRGRARAGLLPALRELHPAAERNVLALADTLQAEAVVLDELVDGVLDGRAEVELVRLRSAPPALAALVLQRLADGAVGRPAPGTARRAAEILALRDPGELHLPHGVRARVVRGVLRMEAPLHSER